MTIMTGAETQERQQEAPKDVGQKAVDTINTAKPEDIKKAVDKKFPDPDKIMESLKEQDYQANKKELIENIINRKLNQEYNAISPDNFAYKNKIFLTENSLQVKAYVAYYNAQIIKGNMINKTDKTPIDIVSFMQKFEQEKPKTEMELHRDDKK